MSGSAEPTLEGLSARFAQIKTKYAAALNEFETEFLLKVDVHLKSPGEEPIPPTTISVSHYRMGLIMTKAIMPDAKTDYSSVFKEPMHRLVTEYHQALKDTLSGVGVMGVERPVIYSPSSVPLSISYNEKNTALASFKSNVSDILGALDDWSQDIIKFSAELRTINHELERVKPYNEALISEVMRKRLEVLRLDWSLKFADVWWHAVILDDLEPLYDFVNWMHDNKACLNMIKDIENYPAICDPSKADTRVDIFVPTKEFSVQMQLEAYRMSPALIRKDVYHLTHHLIEASISATTSVDLDVVNQAKKANALSILTRLQYDAAVYQATALMGAKVAPLDDAMAAFVQTPRAASRARSAMLSPNDRAKTTSCYAAIRIREVADTFYELYDKFKSGRSSSVSSELLAYLTSTKLDASILESLTSAHLMADLAGSDSKKQRQAYMKALLLCSNHFYRSSIKAFGSYASINSSMDESLIYCYHETVGFGVKVACECLKNDISNDKKLDFETALSSFLKKRVEPHADSSKVVNENCMLAERWCPEIIADVFNWLKVRRQYDQATSYALTRIALVHRAYSVLSKRYAADALKMRSIQEVKSRLDKVLTVPGIQLIKLVDDYSPPTPATPDVPTLKMPSRVVKLLGTPPAEPGSQPLLNAASVPISQEKKPEAAKPTKSIFKQRKQADKPKSKLTLKRAINGDEAVQPQNKVVLLSTDKAPPLPSIAFLPAEPTKKRGAPSTKKARPNPHGFSF